MNGGLKKILFGKLQTKYLCVPKEHKVQIVGSILVPSTS